MSEIRQVYQIPVHILQEFIIILRTNEKYIGEGKIRDYYIMKDEKLATIIYDNNQVSFVANFVKDQLGNWFFIDKIIIRDSLKEYISPDIIARYSRKEIQKDLIEETKKEGEENKKVE